jgi:hypothetical protein
MRQNPILNTDEPAIEICCVNETSHQCFLDKIEIYFENEESYTKSYDDIELVEGKPRRMYITLSQLNLDTDSMPRKRIKRITVFDAVRGIWKVESRNIDSLNQQIFY